MKNLKTKNRNQVKFFDLIKKELPANLALVEVVADLLGVGTDATYRRIRGDKPLDFEEIVKLCKHFQISFDSLVGIKSAHQFDCIYRPINLSIPNEYGNYMFDLSKSVAKLRTYEDSNIITSASDIPLFHLVFYKELRFFKLYTWFHSVYGYDGCLDEFMQEIETPDIVICHQKISKDYELIPSSEIWTENTINATLGLISYYIDICSFSSKDLPLLLCEQVLDILNKLQRWAENGNKGKITTPFQLYVSEMELENTYILMKRASYSNCILKLFTINSFNVLDREFCAETEHWLTKMMQRSTLLCSNSEKERIKFFNSQRQKVMSLIEKIEFSFEK